MLKENRTNKRDCVICSVEYLEPKSALLDTQIADLSQISGIDVGPGIALARWGVAEVCREVLSVFMGLNYVADTKGVDVSLVATCELYLLVFSHKDQI
jgi:hypothetical protein